MKQWQIYRHFFPIMQSQYAFCLKNTTLQQAVFKNKVLKIILGAEAEAEAAKATEAIFTLYLILFRSSSHEE
jgi:hypothetical protein